MNAWLEATETNTSAATASAMRIDLVLLISFLLFRKNGW
jgi:hypothetical protein